MTVDKLREQELALMRTAFERACAVVGLPLQVDEADRNGTYAQIAFIVQRQVESGFSDVDAIAAMAAESLKKTPRVLSA